MSPKRKHLLNRRSNFMEDPVGFEPTVRELQSLAFPLGYGSGKIFRIIKSKVFTYSQDDRWSGKQDLNLRPLGPKPSALPS